MAKEAASALIPALEDKDEGVRKAAADSLKTIDPQAAIKAGLP